MAGLLLTYFAHRQAMVVAHRSLQANFDFRVRTVASRVEQRIMSYKLALHGASGMLAAGGETVDAKAFGRYAERSPIEKNYISGMSLGFTRAITRAKKNQHLASNQRNQEGYRIWPEGDREFYAAVNYVEPRSRRFLAVVGYDMFTSPELRSAMELARDQNQVVMSAKAELMAEQEVEVMHSVLLFMPVYRGTRANDTLQDRRAHIVGWVYASLALDELAVGVLGEYGTALALEIHDGKPSAETLLHRSGGTQSKALPLFQTERSIEVGSRNWVLKIHSLPALEARLETKTADALRFLGVLLSVILSLYVWSLITGRQRALAVADSMTRDLQDSEFRWKFALEGSGDGLWDWDIRSGAVFFSSRWKVMLGFANDEIGSHVSEWEKRIHPDDRARVMAELQPLLDGQKMFYTSEHRLQCKDGSWKWILDRGMVVSRGADGKPWRVIGTHTDIDDRHMSAMRIQRLTQLYQALSLCNRAIVHADSEQELLQEVCRIAVEFGEMKMAWVGLLDQEGTINIVATAGVGQEYLDGLIKLANMSDQLGPAQACVRENQPVWCQDFMDSYFTQPPRERAQQFGWRAIAVLPLRRLGRMAGVFSLYADQVNAFDGEVRELLLEMARDVCNAMDGFQHRAMREQAEQALRESEAFNTTVLDSLVEHIAVLDTRGGIVSVNRAWCDFAWENSAPREEAFWVGKSYIDACLQTEQGAGEVAAAGIRAVLSGEQPRFEMEYACHSPFEQRWFKMLVTPLQGARQGAVVAHENISRRKRTENEINLAHARLEEVSLQLISTQETERKKLARELHDELGQRFTTLNINLHRLQPQAPDAETQDIWQQAVDEVGFLIRRVREMSGSLRPPMLDHLGLEAAVRQLLQQTFRSTSTNFVFEYAGLPRKLPGPVEITAYRIIQEGITNIVRHAQASRIVIEINGGEEGEELNIILRDNGKGLSTSWMEMVERHGGYGLAGMRERVTLLGGTFTVESDMGKGVRIEVLIPLN